MEGDLDKSLLRDVQTSVFRIAGGYLQHSPPVYCIFIRSHILTFQWIVPGSMGWTEKNSISTNPSFLCMENDDIYLASDNLQFRP